MLQFYYTHHIAYFLYLESGISNAKFNQNRSLFTKTLEQKCLSAKTLIG